MAKSTGIQLVSLIVADYDEALEFFVTKLGFELIEDSPATTSHSNKPKRWVTVRPPGSTNSAAILLARAEGESQKAVIGQQWAGRVGLFWQVDDFDDTYKKMRAAGVKVETEPRQEAYGRVVVWHDLYGNKWDLLGPAKDT
jgi:catechol 2,3-dioxygenase-like lactoylglutathione lyase family enzyme